VQTSKSNVQHYDIPNCPHCGSNSGVYANIRAAGWCEEQWSADSGHEVLLDGLKLSQSATLRCPDCKKIRRDVVRAENDRIVRAKLDKGVTPSGPYFERGYTATDDLDTSEPPAGGSDVVTDKGKE